MRIRRKKQLCWNRFRATFDPIDYTRFAQECNKLRKLTRKLQQGYKAHLANGVQGRIQYLVRGGAKLT